MQRPHKKDLILSYFFHGSSVAILDMHVPQSEQHEDHGYVVK